MFLRMLLPSFCVLIEFKEKVWSLGVVSASVYLVTEVHGCLIVCLQLNKPPHIWGLLDLYALEYPMNMGRQGQQGTMDQDIVHMSSAHAYGPLSHWTSLTKYKFKDKKFLNNFRTMAAAKCRTRQIG